MGLYLYGCVEKQCLFPIPHEPLKTWISNLDWDISETFGFRTTIFSFQIITIMVQKQLQITNQFNGLITKKIASAVAKISLQQHSVDSLLVFGP